jgi:hypothetical protein
MLYSATTPTLNQNQNRSSVSFHFLLTYTLTATVSRLNRFRDKIKVDKLDIAVFAGLIVRSSDRRCAPDEDRWAHPILYFRLLKAPSDAEFHHYHQE